MLIVIGAAVLALLALFCIIPAAIALAFWVAAKITAGRR